jgi:hypothetical protein
VGLRETDVQSVKGSNPPGSAAVVECAHVRTARNDGADGVGPVRGDLALGHVAAGADCGAWTSCRMLTWLSSHFSNGWAWIH